MKWTQVTNSSEKYVIFKSSESKRRTNHIFSSSENDPFDFEINLVVRESMDELSECVSEREL